MTQEKDTMKVSATRFETDMYGNTFEEKVDITYFFDEWADFDD